MTDLHEAYEAVFDKDALIAELRSALDEAKEFVIIAPHNHRPCRACVTLSTVHDALARADAYLKAKS